MSEDSLVEMIIEAHDACKSENMDCPWCSGHIGVSNEHHDQFCRWEFVIKPSSSYLLRSSP